MADAYYDPYGDGLDYAPGGRYFMFRNILSEIHTSSIPEEVKRRRIKHLREEIIPFWHVCDEVRRRESEELRAVFMKYNGPEGRQQKLKSVYDSIKKKVSDDAGFLGDMERHNPNPTSRSGQRKFTYGDFGSILYDIDQDADGNSPAGKTQSDSADDNGPIGANPETAEELPHHHNKNPDDNFALRRPLLELVKVFIHDCEPALPFLNAVDETVHQDYYTIVKRPRDLKTIEKWLQSKPSYGYGPTAFFNDMLLLFKNCRQYYGLNSDQTNCANYLEREMKSMVSDEEWEEAPDGAQLLDLYNAIVEQGPETWPDPEWILSQPGYNPMLPGYHGREPDVSIETLKQEQLERGQERVEQLRRRLAEAASGTGQGAAEQPPVDDEAPRDPLSQDEAPHDGGSRKRPRDEDDDDVIEIDPEHFPKRQRSHRSPTPRPTNSDRSPRRRAAAKGLRPAAQDGAAADDAEAVAGQGASASKAASPSDAPGSSSRAASFGSGVVGPLHAAQKRGREPTDDGSEDDGVEAGEGRGPAGSKRLRLRENTPPAHIFAAHPEAAPSTPKRAATDGDDVEEPGSAQSHADSPATEPSPRPVVFPKSYPAPASKFLKFSRNSINMSKIAKMGKRRPWLFGFKTTEGFGIYAFASCPRGNCKHHFSEHPLREHRAYDHIFDCGQPLRDERHMVKDYAVQVIKDEGRKSDLTVDWARKSNLNLLSAKLKDNHPENFPLAPPDDDDEEYPDEEVPE